MSKTRTVTIRRGDLYWGAACLILLLALLAVTYQCRMAQTTAKTLQDHYTNAVLVPHDYLKHLR